jgi:hypothetical protein
MILIYKHKHQKVNKSVYIGIESVQKVKVYTSCVQLTTFQLITLSAGAHFKQN